MTTLNIEKPYIQARGMLEKKMDNGRIIETQNFLNIFDEFNNFF